MKALMLTLSLILFNVCSFGQVTTYKYVEYYGADLSSPESRKKQDTKVIVSTSPDDNSIEIIIDGSVHPVELIDEKNGDISTVKLYKRIGSHPDFGIMMILMTYGKTEDSLSIYFDGKTGTVRYSVY